jgi:8-oxo-dGTP diphosphatase
VKTGAEVVKYNLNRQLIEAKIMPVSDQGTSTDHYTLIPRTLIFLTCDGKVLLLKGSPEKRLWAGLYNGIGGHIEPGEDVLSSARRELHEETGLDIPNLWLCGTVIIDTGANPGISLYVLRGEISEDNCAPDVPIDSPDGTLQWVPLSRVYQLPLVEDLPTLLPHVFQSRLDAPPFSALYKYDKSDRMQIAFG